MKKIIALVFFQLLIGRIYSQALELDWLVSGLNNSIYWSKKSTINETDSCIYSVGVFQNGMSMEQFTINSTYAKSIFLSKTNENGNVIWLKNIADLSYTVDLTSRTTISTDGNGNILLGISFNDKIYFNEDSITFDTPNNEGVALFKLDTSSNFLWSKKIFSESLGKEGILVDELNNIYLTGTANQNVFISKFSETGDSLWTKTGGSAAGYDIGQILRLDSSNNIYVLGIIQPSNGIYFDSYHPTFVAPYNNGSFLAKYSDIGEIQWVRCFYASNFGEAVSASSMEILENDQIVIGGAFSGDKIKFYPSAPFLYGNVNGFDGSFLLSYSVDGELTWKKIPHNNFGGWTSINRIISSFENNGFFTATSYSGTIGVLTDTLSGNTQGSSFIEEYDDFGSSLWYYRYGGSNIFSTLDILKSLNNLFIAGSTNSNPIYFNDTPYSLATNPSFYIAKLHYNSVSVNEMDVNIFSISPNPTSGNVELQSQNSLKGEEAVIYNTLGEIVTKQILNNPFSNELTIPEHLGVYFVRVGAKTIKVVRQ